MALPWLILLFKWIKYRRLFRIGRVAYKAGSISNAIYKFKKIKKKSTQMWRLAKSALKVSLIYLGGDWVFHQV